MGTEKEYSSRSNFREKGTIFSIYDIINYGNRAGIIENYEVLKEMLEVE